MGGFIPNNKTRFFMCATGRFYATRQTGSCVTQSSKYEKGPYKKCFYLARKEKGVMSEGRLSTSREKLSLKIL